MLWVDSRISLVDDAADIVHELNIWSVFCALLCQRHYFLVLSLVFLGLATIFPIPSHSTVIALEALNFGCASAILHGFTHFTPTFFLFSMQVSAACTMPQSLKGSVEFG